METNTQTTPQTPETPGLTPEQALALETARLERVKAQADLLREQTRHAEMQSESRAITEGQAVKDAVQATGIRFYDSDLPVTLARKDYDLRFAEDGTGTGLVNGERVPLTEVFREIARKHPTLADGRTTKALREPEPEPLNRATMTRADKIAYLNSHTLEEFEAFPSRPPMKTVEVRYFEDFTALPMSAKTELLAKHGETWLGRLPRRDGKGTHRFEQVSGV